LDPKWVTGHIRRAQVFAALDRLEDAMRIYDNAISLCDDEKQKQNYESQRQQVLKKIDQNTGTTGTIISKDEMSDFFIKRMEADIPDPSKFLTLCPSPLGYLTAADKIYRAYNTPEKVADIARHLEWMEGMEVLSKLRVENKIYVRTAGRVTEALTSAIVEDERAILIDNMKETYRKLQLQVQAEQQQWDAIGPNMSVKDLIKHYKVYLPNVKLTTEKTRQGRVG